MACHSCAPRIPTHLPCFLSSFPFPVEYVHTCAHDQEEAQEVRDLATSTWQAMKRTAKAGQRRTLPDMPEIDSLFKGQKQNAVVYFLDETFEELQYDASTTVAEAVEQLAAHIKLENYQTFSLFAVQKVGWAVRWRRAARCQFQWQCPLGLLWASRLPFDRQLWLTHAIPPEACALLSC